jgi:hypothetical protein
MKISAKIADTSDEIRTVYLPDTSQKCSCLSQLAPFFLPKDCYKKCTTLYICVVLLMMFFSLVTITFLCLQLVSCENVLFSKSVQVYL